jgi:hypothetical protein
MVLPGRPEIVMAQAEREIEIYWVVTDEALASLVYFSAHLQIESENRSRSLVAKQVCEKWSLRQGGLNSLF